MLYILLSGVGVWQLVAPSIANRSFIFVIAIAAIVIAVIFAWTTATNYKAGDAERKARKKAKEEEEKREQAKKEKPEAELEEPQEPAQLENAQSTPKDEEPPLISEETTEEEK